MEYRVLESHGNFTVQVKDTIKQVSGFLWWRKVKIIDNWTYCDNQGLPYYLIAGWRINPRDPMQTFKSLDAAIGMIRSLLQPPQIHYIDEQVSK